VPICAELFGYGRVTLHDVHFTAQALAALSVGLPSYILIKVLTPGYYARHDTKTPVRYAMLSMLVNLVLNLALIVPLEHMGPPLATAIASSVNVAMLYATLKKRGQFAADARLRRRAPRLLLAALLMGALLWGAQGWILPYTPGPWWDPGTGTVGSERGPPRGETNAHQEGDRLRGVNAHGHGAGGFRPGPAPSPAAPRDGLRRRTRPAVRPLRAVIARRSRESARGRQRDKCEQDDLNSH